VRARFGFLLGPPEFPPVLDLVAALLGCAGLLACAQFAGGPYALAAARLLVGAAFLGSVSDAMLLGHWYLVQPGLARGPLLELVRWTNATSAPHTVTASGAFDSGTIPPRGTYARTFTQLGTFNYLCAIHPNMTGFVIVTSVTNPSATPTPSAQAQVALIKHDGNYSFSPSELSIPVGTVVTWVNTTGDALTVDGPGFQSPLIPKEGGAWSHTFTVPGTYSYTSRVRPKMTGTILVSP
jgi:plastocyanin